MAGQVNVTINGHVWAAYLANEAWELSQGLSNIASMDAGTGMFFDTGYQHLIGVQTLQMLFNLDIAFIDTNFKVVEIHRNVPNEQQFTSTEQARYFLEVNAGEMADINVGDSVVVELVTGPVVGPVPAQGISDIWGYLTMMLPMMVVAGFGVGMIKSTTSDNPGTNNPGPRRYPANIPYEWRQELRRMSTSELDRAYSRLRVGESSGIDFIDASPALGEDALEEILYERGVTPHMGWAG